MDLQGKTIVFLGDSITQGVGASAPDLCYVSLFQKAHPEATVINCGVSGTRFAKQSDVAEDDYLNVNRFTLRAQTMPEADFVVVFGGINDYGHGNAPLGVLGDTEDDTFYGAAYALFTRLITRYPTAQFLVLTPLHCIKEPELSIQGAALPEYVRAIRETAEVFSLPVLDLYAGSGINPNMGNLQAVYMTDGLHPNDAGHRRVFERIDAYIRNFY